MDQSLSPEPEEKAVNADQTPDAQPVPDEVAALEHEEAEQSPYEDLGYGFAYADLYSSLRCGSVRSLDNHTL